jgi:plastocyanin
MQRDTKFFLWALVAAAVLGVTLVAMYGQPTVSANTTPAAGGQQIAIDNFSFGPETITVPAGTKVTWVNHDDIPHTVVAAGKFKSHALDTSDHFDHTFDEPGTYEYFCSLHPKMTGKIVVQPKPKAVANIY